MKPVRFGMVGIGNYAQSYHHSIAQMKKEGFAELIAVAENRQENYRDEISRLKDDGVRMYDDYNELLRAEKGNIDFVALPIGIHLHAPMTMAALEAGFQVICEKPLTATVQKADEMMAARDRAKAIVLVGYQEVMSPSILKLKERIMDGRLGQVRLAKTMGRWPRPDSYYQRANWAGKLKVGSEWVLDGIAMNAMAHHVNNMLFLASPEPNATAQPIEVQAELYRAHQIESYDTVSLRSKVDSGSTVYFIATHAPETEYHPELRLECENGNARRDFVNGATVVSYNDGTEERFDDENLEIRTEVFRNAIACFRGEASPKSTLEMAKAHTLCMNGAHESCPDIATIPANFISRKPVLNEEGEPTEDMATFVTGIDSLMDTAFSEAKLFSEINAPWGRKTAPFSMKNYSAYPSK